MQQIITHLEGESRGAAERKWRKKTEIQIDEWVSSSV